MDEKNFQLVGSELAQVVMTPKQKEQQRQREQQLAVLEGLRITAEMALPPLEFLFKMNDKPCFPRGELVTVSGKAKSGKTFFLTLLMAACTAAEEVVGIARMPDTPPLKCLWYDTEQSRQSTLEILRDRISKLSHGIEDGMYDIFNCRSVDWQERLALLETAIAQGCPDFVVIDGICDLIADINDGVMGNLFPRVNPRFLHQPQPLLHKKGLRPSPQTPQPSPGQGLNRSACRSYISVSSTHQRVGLSLLIAEQPLQLYLYI